MPEDFFALPEPDRREALEVAASRINRPAAVLEKDVWVVWALDCLGSTLGEALYFKGGTSLSKAYWLIQRFSEDVDLTYDIRRLLHEATGDGIPATRSQASKWTKQIRRALPDLLDREILPLLRATAPPSSEPTIERDGSTIRVIYRGMVEVLPYLRPHVLLEFGARTHGEPCELRQIVCDADSAGLDGVHFPSARIRTMLPERTFWEKATAAHVYCVRERFRGGPGWSRHWFDLAALHQSGVSNRARSDVALARRVAAFKAMMFAEPGVDYLRAVSGELSLVPGGEALSMLKADYIEMVDAGLLLGDPPTFEALMDCCTELEQFLNRPLA